MRFLTFSFLICLSVLPGISQAAEEPEVPLISKLKNHDEKESQQAFEAILAERQKLIQSLIAIASNKKIREENPKVAGRAITLLGKMRATEAIDLLVTLMTFSDIPNPDPYELNTSDKLFPAVAALMEIGKPAIKTLLKRVAEGKLSKYEVKEVGWIISGIEGKALGKESVLSYMKKLENEEERKRLEDPQLNVFWDEPLKKP